MLIDWFTVGSQILNFIILVALLKFFLYDRIIRAMDEREQKVQQRLEDADTQKKEAEAEAQKYRQQNEELEKQKKEILSQAKAEAEDRKKELTREIRNEADAMRKRWIESVEQEKASFLRDLRQMTGRHVYATVKKVLKDLSNEALEKQVVSAFVRHLKSVEEERLKPLGDEIKASGKELRVLSGFEVSSNFREKIKKAVQEKIDGDIDITYERSSNMGLDMELKTEGRRFSWGIADYLDRLEETAARALNNEFHHGGEEPEDRQSGNNDRRGQ